MGIFMLLDMKVYGRLVSLQKQGGLSYYDTSQERTF